MNALALSSPAALSALLALVPDQVPEIYRWRDDFVAIAAAPKGRRMAAVDALAERRGVPSAQVYKLLQKYEKQGIAGLIDRRNATQLWESKQPRGLSVADQELVKTWCEKFQRKNEPAIRAMLEAWRSQRISRELAERGLAVPHTDTPLDPTTGYPRGWGGEGRNLLRYAPKPFALKAARIGRTAAAAHRPLVYTTRRNLYVGQFILWDDMWHDHEVVDLDQKKRGRPLEFHALDLASACKIIWGNRTRILREDGSHEGLKGGDYRFLLAAQLGGIGYHPRGTTNVIEWGTTNLPEEIERLIFDATGGLVRFERGGMEGAAAHAGQYAGRRKGNFKFKAALESLGNLIHNEMAYLMGQTGMDRDHAPEEQHGRQKHTDALLMALSQLDEKRIEWLRWDYCTIQQFRMLCEQVYGVINGRVEHDLEGWDERYVPDARTGRMRRMSPWEVWTPGRRALQTIDEATVALIIGHEQGTERLTRNGMIELRDGEISGDLLRYDATALPDREKFLTVLNPFDARRLFCFDARGRFVRAIDRMQSVCRADVEAVHREMGRAAKQEAELLAPLRLRHLAEAREKAARHAHNVDVLSGTTAAERKEAEIAGRSAVRLGEALIGARFEQDSAPALSTDQTQNPEEKDTSW